MNELSQATRSQLPEGQANSCYPSEILLFPYLGVNIPVERGCRPILCAFEPVSIMCKCRRDRSFRRRESRLLVKQ